MSCHTEETRQRRRKKNWKDGKRHIDMDELMDLSELQKVLEDYAREAEEIYRYQLSLGGKNASRALADSAKAHVVVGEQYYEVVMNLKEYWKFVERGRAGTESSPAKANVGNLPSYVPSDTRTELNMSPGKAGFPPVGAIMNWISVKPVLPRPDASGKMQKLRPKSLAFLIGRKIQEEGIEPHPALATTIQELDRLYKDKIAEALGRDVGAYIRKLVEIK